MEHQVKTPYGTVSFKNECPPERVQEILTQYAYAIDYGKEEKKDAA